MLPATPKNIERLESRIIAMERRLDGINGDGRTVRVQKLGGSITISSMAAGRSGNSAYEYRGPFAVIEEDSTTVTVLGYHADEGRNWRNYIDLGLETPLELDEMDYEDITSSGWLFLWLTQTDNAYDEPAISFATVLPQQDNENYYRRLAYVYCVDGKISSIEQWQYGGIVMDGRIV